MEKTIFEKMVIGEIPVDKLYEDEYVIAIKDINPIADTHVLVLPKVHFESISQASSVDPQFLGNFLISISKVAKSLGLDDYKLLFNNGKNAGQTVFYCHAHILFGNINKQKI